MLGKLRDLLFDGGPKLYGSHHFLEMLEDRIVLDASVLPADQNNQDNPDNGGADSALENQLENPGPTTGSNLDSITPDTSDALQDIVGQDLSVILISNAVDQIESISAAADDDAVVIEYDTQEDSLASVIDELAELVDSTGKKIDHLAIVSHGEPGTLILDPADDVYSLATMEQDAHLWQELGGLMTSDGRIDFYGCEIGKGEEGLSFVTQVAELTGVSVWASSDMTGNSENADWDLEIKTSNGSDLSAVFNAALVEDLFSLSGDPNTPPYVLVGFQDARVQLGNLSYFYTLVSVFSDLEDLNNLDYSVVNVSNPDLIESASIVDRYSGGLYLTFATGVTGTADITVRATDSGGLSVEDAFHVTVYDPRNPDPPDPGDNPGGNDNEDVVGGKPYDDQWVMEHLTSGGKLADFEQVREMFPGMTAQQYDVLKDRFESWALAGNVVVDQFAKIHSPSKILSALSVVNKIKYIWDIGVFSWKGAHGTLTYSDSAKFGLSVNPIGQVMEVGDLVSSVIDPKGTADFKEAVQDMAEKRMNNVMEYHKALQEAFEELERETEPNGGQ